MGFPVGESPGQWNVHLVLRPRGEPRRRGLLRHPLRSRARRLLSEERPRLLHGQGERGGRVPAHHHVRVCESSDETVTVPAGTFDTVKVVCRHAGTGALSLEIWYSLAVKQMVRERSVFAYGVRERELIAYKLR